MLNVSPIPAFQDNYIWLITNNNHAVVVDPGAAAPVEQVLAERGLTLEAILITHHHHDHTGGVKALLDQWPNARVYAPAAERLPAPGSIALSDGDNVSLPELGLELEVMSVPGHTLGHIAYYAPPQDQAPQGQPLLFCGDTLFSGGCGRLFEGTPGQMYQSLSRLAALSDDTRVYCTHEYTQANLAFCHAVEPNNPELKKYLQNVAKLRQQGVPTLPSPIGLEKAVNVFLRAHLAGVRAATQAHEGVELIENIDVFAALRRWKDDF
ncbi:hydroxyacylglutathione hydrolase [Oceanisphaera arctica]|uniref:Hydroxyacylglutathione hydrolase n=1 Tax=Oceanisphaera arctica TaxID=641510 RepID=A0A2P5TRD6_9GAMM|nr:hydroxyacylglutathione hydrolase [Oceanisphaera arctica]PPL18387.1 hydroxyacylglutathione hydrolase [Oceanisphaera arctica]GHA27245.1 hydroxyacylglutathione hydrolase [Oceanisphaera arctica]